MSQVLTRTQVEEKLKWNLSHIMDEGEIEKYFTDIRAGIAEISRYKNKLNADNALEVLLVDSKVSYKFEKLISYISMKSDEDKSDTKYLELSARAENLGVEFSAASAFIAPAFASFKIKVLEEMKKNPEFSYYTMFLDSVIRDKKHILSVKEEALLAEVHSFAGGFRHTFSMFDNVDIDFGEIEIEGEKHKITHGYYAVLLQNPDRAIRKKAYDSIYAAYKGMTNTLASNYEGNVKQTYFWAKVKRFKNCLEKALYSRNIPARVYENLVESVKENTPLMHKYVALRKKALKLDTMAMYDMSVPIVGGISRLTPYDEAYKIVLDALKPLGSDYCKVLKEAYTGGWIDVMETKNKRSGAYCSGSYGTHPYVLLNHSGTPHDVFTIAHEMGHAMHSYYSNKTQVYEKAGYGIFIAEIASTVNEVLLIKHLLKTAKGEERAFLLSYFCDMIRTTLFRQTMFAEFEKFSHETVEKGEALTSEKMTAFYRELNYAYYGDAVETDENIGYEWSRIPHFYRDFYVFQYSTGITCAINIVETILKNPQKVKDYIEFLSTGGSLYPMDTLQIMGIDLTKKTAFAAAMKEFEETVKGLSETL